MALVALMPTLGDEGREKELEVKDLADSILELLTCINQQG